MKRRSFPAQSSLSSPRKIGLVIIDNVYDAFQRENDSLLEKSLLLKRFLFFAKDLSATGVGCLLVNNLFDHLREEEEEWTGGDDEVYMNEQMKDDIAHKEKVPGLGKFYGAFINERYELSKFRFDNQSTKGQRMLRVYSSQYLPFKTIHLIIRNEGIFGIDEDI